ncbi:Undecaprenyldiphospho-muramoylpentapeptide beta-N- acetylglucosaminyltransferase [Bertholletia excelsa]
MATTSRFHSPLNVKFTNPLNLHSLLSISTAFTFPLIKRRNIELVCCLSIEGRTGRQNAAVKDESGGDIVVMFAAGGTGGHIYPALAIADELRTRSPRTQIRFVGTPTGMESTVIPSAGYDFSAVPAVPLARPLFSPQNLFFFPYHLVKSLIASWRQLHDFSPQIVVGTGGYVSFPICLIAALRGIKLVIQEQNAAPGIANRVLSYFADKIFVAFESTMECFPQNKCVVCGNPIRFSLRQYMSKAVARIHFFPSSAKLGDSEAKVVLVLGGSLGSNTINITLLNLYYQMLMEYDKLFIIWQTGVATFDEMESLVKNHPRLILKPFLHSMDMAYAAADLIISRAGAMTCFEILATGKPSILIPSPNVAEGHQLKNASVMAASAGSRVLMEDELDSTTLEDVIKEILENDSLRAEMSEKALKAAKPNASAEIVEHILALATLS